MKKHASKIAHGMATFILQFLEELNNNDKNLENSNYDNFNVVVVHDLLHAFLE